MSDATSDHPDCYMSQLASVANAQADKIKSRYYQDFNVTPGLEGLDLIMTDYWFKCAKEAIAASLVSAGKRAFVYRFAHNLSIAAELWDSEFGLPQCVSKVRGLHPAIRSADAWRSVFHHPCDSCSKAVASQYKSDGISVPFLVVPGLPHGGASVRFWEQRHAGGDGLGLDGRGDCLLCA